MKILNNILDCRLAVILAAIIIFGAFSSAFAQNEIGAKYNVFTTKFKFAVGSYSERNFLEYPKPDFSGIEKWYEIIRYEYGDFEGGKNELNFWIKTKTEARPDFTVAYYDRDGVLIGGARWACFCEGSCYVNAPIGTVQKWNAGAPSETDMKKVTSVKVVRNEN